MSHGMALARWPLVAIGVIFILVGLPLVIGGAWLLMLGGSFYYLPAGLAFVASGALLVLGRPLGAWIYTGLRVIHTLVQVTANKVMVRFVLFALSSVVLMALIVVAAVRVFA